MIRISYGSPLSSLISAKLAGLVVIRSRETRLSLHCDGNAADGRRYFGAHLRAAKLQDHAVRILQLNATGAACDGSTRTARRIAACKIAGAAQI